MTETWVQDRKAINYLEQQILSLGWMWREQPILDRGIDGNIEICVHNSPTGKLIAVQSKGGKSYFRRNRDGSLKLILFRRHLEYWNSYALPVLVIGYLPSESSSYWVYIQKYISENPRILDSCQNTISVPVSIDHVLALESKQLLLSIIDEDKERILMQLFENRNLDMSIEEQLTKIAERSNIEPHNFEYHILNWIRQFGKPLGKSIALLAANETNAAQQALATLITDTEKYLANQYAWLASSFVQGSDYPSALKYAEKALSLNPHDYAALNIKGITYGEGGKHKEAIEIFKEVSSINPQFAAPFTNIGEIFLVNKEYKKAIYMFKEAIKRFPDKQMAYRLRGDCYKHLKKYDLAEEDYLRTLKLSDDADALKGLGDIAYYRGKYFEAEEFYSKSIAIDKTYFRTYFNRGMARKKQGKISLAKRDFRKTIALKPNYKPALNALKGKED